MRKVYKIIKWFFLFLIILLLIISFRPAWTPSITSVNGKKSIASLEKIELGNLKQYVLIRSIDINNPILLFIHGGPGMPLMYLSHSFQRPLEKRFTVVQWDQRGAGKSYDPAAIPTETINVEQYIADAIQLIDTLRIRYHQQKIYLVGHSWGTYLSSILVQRHPELFYAYISVGQVVDGDAAQKIQREFLLSEANKRNDTSLLTKLNQPGFTSFENYIFKFGGELKHATSFAPLVITGLFSTEYTFRDALNVAKGPQFCGKYMNYNAIHGSIMSNIKKYEVPVFFLTGTHDYTTPFALIKEYCDCIQAPFKQVIWFNESAHFPFYEEPKKFDSVMIYQILNPIKAINY
jgi:pimeloyl-ACP methyl ester carboxylesterase